MWFFRSKEGPPRGDEHWPCRHVLLYSVSTCGFKRCVLYAVISELGGCRWLKNREFVELDGTAAEREAKRRGQCSNIPF
ncbi:hypothetical protein M407DRAFT_241750 [Tulasnella calospora MUT 4182]|uniref:Uncharacterized protein n=1 Tax=Tulasnella calospora MUT 4182 TaxID=1051891 RepID=A0A0C3LCP5_9AGAM|nr:hypothetical protein M407DRAFT_241750 [Tulasnella calospora MUT 4182]